MLRNVEDGKKLGDPNESDRQVLEAVANARPGKPEDLIGLRSLVSIDRSEMPLNIGSPVFQAEDQKPDGKGDNINE